jgi:hypothetical protein
MLGAFFPLIHYLITNKIENQEIELRNFGPMNRHLLDLPYLQTNNITVSFNDELSPDNADVVLENHDVVYRKKGFYEVVWMARKYLIENLADESYATNLLIVDRGKPPAEYDEINHSSGNLRRSVPNMKAFYNHVKEKDSVKFVRLEKATLKKNVSLFYHANWVVAQHGGALTNAVFMRSTAQVIEIPFGHRAHFYRLCNKLGITHQFFGPPSGWKNPDPRIDKETLKRRIWGMKLL